MGLARDIVTLYRRIAAGNGRLFGAAAENELSAKPEFATLVPDLPDDPASTLVLCMQTLAVLEQELEPRLIDAEFVATLPSTATAAAKPTDVAVKEMLASAQREVIALGYEICDPEVLEALQNAARRAQVTLILDRVRSAEAHPLKSWPAGIPRPTVFQDRERDDAAKFAKMHGKALLVDGRDLLVSSANFTFHGMRGNVEFGVRLQGAVAGRAGDVFRQLVESGLLEKLN
jgi:phosphatidylserine/phosphatidylglycerophosphate/cardiolipin synthase-like enzyme